MLARLERPLLALALVSLLTTSLLAQEKKLLSIEDLYLMESPRSAMISPDGKAIVYIRNRVADRRSERNSLWQVDVSGGKPRPMEDGEPDARSPVYSPDGKWIAFLSTRERPRGWQQTPTVPLASDPATDIWLMPARGGRAIPLVGAIKPYGRVFSDSFYGQIAFSPDSSKLVFVADDGKDVRTKEEIANDVQIVRPDQGEGYTGYGTAQLWVAHLNPKPGAFASSRIDRLTDDDVWYGDPQWSPDGTIIACHANRTEDRESVRYSINRNFDIWAIHVASKKMRPLTRGPGPEVSPRFSPDGKTVACLSIPRRGSHRDVFNLALISMDEPRPNMRVLFDHHASRKPPHLPPAFPLPPRCWDGNTDIVYNAERGVTTELMRVDVRTGKGERLNLQRKTAGRTRDSFVAEMARHRGVLPRANAFLANRHLGSSDLFHWKNSDGIAIEGILTTPPAGVGKAPYPLIVYPHGGPHSRSTLGFDFTVQLFAAHGYAVFQPNFRGSSGYGQAFIDADRFDLGGGDMRDILTGVDHLIEKKLVDGDRLFVYGVSYGGFMTTWLVGHTNRFRAAVAQNAVTDLNMMWGLSDLQSWTEWEFGGYPWDVPERMRKHSPLTYVARVKTPTMILHSRDDRRCPLPMGLAFHKALQVRGVATRMVIYPDEGHGISQPRHREDVLRRVLAWFARYDRK